MKNRRARGQALLETVLGSIVFVTILLVGIFFAEVMVTSMKVTEAGAASLWDATGGLHHRIPTDYSAAGTTLSAANAEVAARYSNFDGRSVALGLPGAPLTQVLTRASNMSIRDCSMGGVGTYRGSLNPAHWLIFRDNGGAHCNAEAFVQGAGAIRLGAFLEGANGFFKQNQRNGVLASGGFKICAINRPAGLNGPCTGRFSMLMDDFGLASGSNLGGNEGSQCPSIIYGLPCVGGNMPFWTATNLAYAASSLLLNTQSSDYETFMQVIFLGDKPSNHSIVPWIPFISTPVSFHMGFTGEDSPLLPFSAFTPWASDPILFSWYWEGSPFAMPFGVPAIAYLNRDGQCYLGRKCADLP